MKRWIRGMAALAMLGALAAAADAMVRPRYENGGWTASNVLGEVKAHGAGAARRLAIGDEMKRGEVVAVSPRGRAELLVGGHSLVKLSPGAVATLLPQAREAGGARTVDVVYLHQGRAELRVDPRRAGGSHRVALATATGTRTIGRGAISAYARGPRATPSAPVFSESLWGSARRRSKLSVDIDRVIAQLQRAKARSGGAR
jgi:hypothetical protein